MQLDLSREAYEALQEQAQAAKRGVLLFVVFIFFLLVVLVLVLFVVDAHLHILRAAPRRRILDTLRAPVAVAAAALHASSTLASGSSSRGPRRCCGQCGALSSCGCRR